MRKLSGRMVFSCYQEERLNMILLDSEVLKNFPGWEVLPAMPSWERRGLSQYSQGEKFVRASAEEDWCNGFFVALMGKLPDHENHDRQGETKINTESDFSTEQVGSLKKKKKRKVKECESSDMEPVESSILKETESAVKQKKKKKKVKSEQSEEDSKTSQSEKIKKKKKKKSKD